MRKLRNLAIAILTSTLAPVFVPSALADRKSDQTEPGLNSEAMQELRDAGLDKYLGQFTPVGTSDVGDGWTKHTFDPDGGNGPICIAGTQYSAFTRMGDPKKLAALQGRYSFKTPGGPTARGFFPLPGSLAGYTTHLPLVYGKR
jgi:hypothetical protein